MPNTINVNSCSPQVDILQYQLSLARREIHNLRQQVKSLTHLHRKEVDEITKKLESWQCLECRNRQTESEETPNELTLRQIGTVHTNFPEKRGTPRQPALCPQATAKLVLNSDVFTNPSHALEGLREFSHMWLLFHFHRNENGHVRAKVAPPRLNGVRTGVFATRSPHRPNPIGLSLVKIDSVEEDAVYFSGVDMVDLTPVVDVKPYIPQYDTPIVAPPTAESAVTEAASSPTPSARVMDGEENSREHVIGAASTSNSRTTIEEYSSRMGEREAPDGEEEETASINNHSQSDSTVTTVQSPTSGHIRVPSWIDQSPVPTLSVTFKEKALAQLQQLGSEGVEKKTIIENVLREDPRSVYLRERWGSHCYVFRIAELCVSCKFNDETHTVTVYQVFQNDPGEGDE